MRNTKLFLLTVLGSLFFLSCSDDDDVIDMPTEPLPFENGILVLNEGNFFGGNASVSFIDNELTTVTNGIFNEVNNRALGDVGQSMAFNDDLAYIVVNNSQTVEIVNRFTFESVGTIDTGLLNPRYIEFVNGVGYITNWGDGTNPDDDYVAIVDLETNTVSSTISVPEGPEWIVVNGTSIYVAHQGGFNQNNIVSVIDATTNTLGTPITVADRPNSMHLVEGSLWVLSGGNPAFTENETAGQLDRINTTTNTVEDTFTFELTEHPGFLSVDGTDLYYLLNGNVFRFNTTDTELPTEADITSVSFFDMTVNNGFLYGVDAADFSSNGSLEVYNLSDNALVTSLEVAIIPGAVFFNPAF